MTDSSWRPSDIFKIVVNPAYAGIGPFDMFLEGEWVENCSYPAIVTDEQWLKTQEANVIEFGARSVLLGIRRELTKAVGVKIDYFFRPDWVEDSISLIIQGKSAEVFSDVLEVLRPKTGLVVHEKSRIVSIDVTKELVLESSRDPDLIHRITPEQFEDLVLNRLQKWGYKTVKTGKVNRKDGGLDIIATHPTGLGLLGRGAEGLPGE